MGSCKMLLAKLFTLFAYANVLEYAIHRWALHGWLWKTHEAHHNGDTSVFFAKSIKGALTSLGLIGASALLFSFWGWLPLIFFLFYYFVVLEGAHWLIHEKHVSKHHMTHHADLKDGNYNVWLPFGDYLFGTKIRRS